MQFVKFRFHLQNLRARSIDHFQQLESVTERCIPRWYNRQPGYIPFDERSRATSFERQTIQKRSSIKRGSASYRPGYNAIQQFKKKKKRRRTPRERPARRPLASGRYPKRAIKNIEHEDSTYRPVKSCIQRVLRLLKRHDQLFILPKRPANFENSTDPPGIPPNYRKFFEFFTFHREYPFCRLKLLH